jgi:signal transduction histidine kinase
VAAWVAALPPRRRERVEDGTLALSLAVVNMLTVAPYRAQIHPFWLALLLAASQCVPLAWRRSHPILVLAILSAPRTLYDALNFGYAPLVLAPAIGFATVMDRSSTAWRWATVAITTAVITVTQAQPGHNQPYDAIVVVLTLAAAGAVGLLNRARRTALTAQERRADVAEAQADERAARAAVAERLRIARELHDVVAHHVSLMAVQAEAAGALLPDRPVEAASSVDLIGQTARQAMTELRRMLGVLREAPPREAPAAAAQPLVLAPAASLARLDEVLDQVRSAGLPVKYTVWGTPVELSPGVDLTAYRIIQEALTNAMRHAPGAATQVEVAYEDEYVTVRVADSGTATVALASPPPPSGENGAGERGFGLAGIAERVSSCGGTLTVGPQELGGFAVVARLPVR